MNESQLRYRMVCGGIILRLISMLVTGVFSATKPANVLVDLSAMESILIARNLSGKVQHALKKELTLLSAMASEQSVQDAAGTIRESGRTAARAKIAAARGYLSGAVRKSGHGFERFIFLDANGAVFAGGKGGRTTAINPSTREIFNRAKTGNVGIGSPFQSKRTGELIVEVCVPIYDGRGTFAGGVTSVVNLSAVIGRRDNVDAGGSGYALLADTTGQLVADARKDLGLSPNPSSRQTLSGLGARMVFEKTGHGFYTYQGEKRHVGFAPVALTGWGIGFSKNAGELIASARSTGYFITGVLIISLLIPTVILPLCPRRLSAPIARRVPDLRGGSEQVGLAAYRVS